MLIKYWNTIISMQGVTFFRCHITHYFGCPPHPKNFRIHKHLVAFHPLLKYYYIHAGGDFLQMAYHPLLWLPPHPKNFRIHKHLVAFHPLLKYYYIHAGGDFLQVAYHPLLWLPPPHPENFMPPPPWKLHDPQASSGFSSSLKYYYIHAGGDFLQMAYHPLLWLPPPPTLKTSESTSI